MFRIICKTILSIMFIIVGVAGGVLFLGMLGQSFTLYGLLIAISFFSIVLTWLFVLWFWKGSLYPLLIIVIINIIIIFSVKTIMNDGII